MWVTWYSTTVQDLNWFAQVVHKLLKKHSNITKHLNGFVPHCNRRRWCFWCTGQHYLLELIYLLLRPCFYQKVHCADSPVSPRCCMTRNQSHAHGSTHCKNSSKPFITHKKYVVVVEWTPYKLSKLWMRFSHLYLHLLYLTATLSSPFTSPLYLVVIWIVKHGKKRHGKKSTWQYH